jgi:hypothetical protein
LKNYPEFQFRDRNPGPGMGRFDNEGTNPPLMRVTRPSLSSPITFMSSPINIYRPKLEPLNRRDGMVQRLWQKWSRF